MNHTYKKDRTHYRIWAKDTPPASTKGREQCELGALVAEFEDIMVARRYVRRRMARDRAEYEGRAYPLYTIEVRHPPAPLRPPQLFAPAP